MEKNIVLSIRMDLRYRCPLLFKTFLFEFSWTSLAIYDRKIIVCDFNIRHFLYKKFERRCFYTVYMKYIVTTFILTDNIILYLMYNSYGGQSRSWSYGSWIYNHLCNQCLSPLTLWVRIVYSIQHYVINCVSDLWQVGGFLLVLWFPSIKLIATI